MSATFDPTLPTTRDLVRFLICDTEVVPVDEAAVSDEELDALIAMSSASGDATAFCVAAEVLSKLLAKFTVSGLKSGIVEKQVSKLRLRFGSTTSTADLLTDRIKHLRQRCAALSGRAFQTLGPSVGRRGRRHFHHHGSS